MSPTFYKHFERGVGQGLSLGVTQGVMGFFDDRYERKIPLVRRARFLE